MKRIKLKDRCLPTYTKGEELTNMISHIAGGTIGIVVTVICLCLSFLHKNAWGVVGSFIYGFSFIQLYTISSVYHGLKPGMSKKVLQVIDHCSIYLFIAGTYTPIMLCSMRPMHPGWAWSILGVVWGLAAMAIVFTAIDLKKYSVFSMICYINMGWCILVGIRPLLETLAFPGVILLVAGGVTYTIGAILYGIGKKHRYMHSLFHFFVLAGSILQALCILIYVL